MDMSKAALPPKPPITEKQKCQWFLRCDEPAATVRSHAILGDVPICARCAEKMAKIESKARLAGN